MRPHSGAEHRAERGTVWRFLSAQSCASIGALALTTILGKQVYDLTKSELALGILGLVEFMPALLLVLLTGTLADRLDRRRMASVAMALEGAAAVALAWYATTDPTSATPIYFMVLAFGVARAFAAPAMRSMPPDLVPPGTLPWLTVRYSGSWQISAIVGPVLGGVLYAVDPVLPFVVVAGLFVSGAAVIMTVRYAAHVQHAHAVPVIAEPLDAIEPGEVDALDSFDVADPVRDAGAGVDAGEDTDAHVDADAGGGSDARPSMRSRVHEALEGYRFIRREPVLLGAITLDLMAVLFGGAIALLPAIAEERLDVGAVGLGWLRAAVGIGAALMTLALAIRPLQRRIGVVLLVAVAGFGAGTIVLGVTTSFGVAFAALAFLSAADAISVYIRATLVPLITPAEMRGRVLAFEMVLIGASNELGAFESGVTGQLLGPAAAVVLGGAASVGVAIGWWFGFPALRRTNRFPTTAASATASASASARAPAPAPKRSGVT